MGETGLPYVAGAQLFASLSGAVFWLVLALLIHPLAYGHLGWLVSIAMLVSTLCLFGLDKTVVVHYPREGKDELLSCSTLFILISSIAIGALVSLLVDLWTGALVVGFSTFSMGFHLKLAKRDYKSYMWMWVGVRTLSLFLPLLIYWAWGLVAGIIVGLSVSYTLFGLPILRKLNLGSGVRELGPKLKFTVSAWLADLGAVSINFLDKILIGLLFGLTVLGFYQFATRVFLLFAVFPQIMFIYLLPERSAGRKTKNVEIGAAVASVALAGIAFAFASLVVPKTFPYFTDGVVATQVMGLAIVPATIARMRTSALYAGGRPNLVLASYAFALAAGITGILSLGKHFGLIGLASNVLLIQTALAASLLTFPRLGGEKGRLTGGMLGMVLLTTLLLSSIGTQPLTIEIRGDSVKGTGLAMDTTVSITVIDENPERAETAIRAAYDEVKRIEKLMSAEDEMSEIYSLNHSGTQWVKLSPETIQVLKTSRKYSELSNGHFDVTVKPLVDLWMKKTRETGRIPPPGELTDAMELVGWRNLEIDEDGGRARFLRKGMQVTLGAVAKGYAVDRACEVLKAFGIESGLVAIGGDIRGFGPRAWRIGIQHPRGEGVLKVLELENFSISTSGDYARFFLIGARRIHHIINPKTGYSATECISVTVITENSVDADVLSTAVFVMGPEEGKELLDSLGVKGLIITPEMRMIKSDAWDY